MPPDQSQAPQTSPSTVPSGAVSDPISPPESIPTPTTETAQVGVNEPFAPVSEPLGEPVSQPQPTAEAKPPQSSSISPRDLARSLLAKARSAIQSRKQKKLDLLMTLFAKRTSITNDEVEKLLHASDATATRYLEILKKENKIKQNSKTGEGVSYSKI